MDIARIIARLILRSNSWRAITVTARIMLFLFALSPLIALVEVATTLGPTFVIPAIALLLLVAGIVAGAAWILDRP